MEGDWEVAILSVSHSNCVNTFNDDVMTVTDTSGDLSRIRSPLRVNINPPSKTYTSTPTYIKDFMKQLNAILKNIVTFKWSRRNPHKFTYEFHTSKYYLYLSDWLSDALHVTNVFTAHDHYKENGLRIRMIKNALGPTGCHVIIVPIDAPHTTIRLKDKNESVHVTDLLQRFRERVTEKFPRIEMIATQSQSHLILKYTNEQPLAIVLSNDFHHKIGFRHNGIDSYSKNNRYYAHNFKDSFSEEWNITLYPLHEVEEYTNNRLTIPLTLKPTLFQSTTQVCDYLTKLIGYEEIILEAKNDIASLTINSKDLSVQFSKDVRDILAFDEQVYQGKCQVTGSDVISLTRRINYFYIYSNVGEFVRVGDTETPLLCHFPFNPKACKLITERTFKQPSYVKVKGNQFSQIDISIYDDAGTLIPFHRDAITSIRLHFRRI